MRDYLGLLAGKFTFIISKLFRLGAGGTWPGEIALLISPAILKNLVLRLDQKVILIAGTNGKTTTSLMLKKILEQHGETVIHNDSGANLLNGVVSTFIKNTSWSGKLTADWGIFEVDENSLPIVMKFVSPQIVILLNLFRDQLDRYGEIDVISEKWQKTLTHLNKKSLVVLNGDDPQIAFLGKHVESRVSYFGLEGETSTQNKKEHATDSQFCPQCGARLIYSRTFFSHLGIWKCAKCKLTRPEPEIKSWPEVLVGLYNKYNTQAAVTAALALSVSKETILLALTDFKPAFGRQEEFKIEGKTVKLFLSKNPVGFNESLKTVIDLGARNLLFVLNDRIPDGRDVSWIWDVDFEMLPTHSTPILSGERVYDLALRLKYASKAETGKSRIYEELSEALTFGIRQASQNDPLYILATYSAMLETRKLLTGKKIS